jgi:hypothetical protein
MYKHQGWSRTSPPESDLQTVHLKAPIGNFRRTHTWLRAFSSSCRHNFPLFRK